MLVVYGLIYVLTYALDELHFHIMLYLYIERLHIPNIEARGIGIALGHFGCLFQTLKTIPIFQNLMKIEMDKVI